MACVSSEACASATRGGLGPTVQRACAQTTATNMACATNPRASACVTSPGAGDLAPSSCVWATALKDRGSAIMESASVTRGIRGPCVRSTHAKMSATLRLARACATARTSDACAHRTGRERIALPASAPSAARDMGCARMDYVCVILAGQVWHVPTNFASMTALGTAHATEGNVNARLGTQATRASF